MKDVSLKLGAVAVATIATTAIIATASNAHFDKSNLNEQNKIIKSQNKVKVEKEDMISMSAKTMDMSDMEKFHKFMKERKFKEAIGFAENTKPYMFDKMNHKKMMKHHELGKDNAIKVALEENDYNAWLKAVGKDSKRAKIITKDKFSQLVKAHKLMKEAQEIRLKLGLKE